MNGKGEKNPKDEEEEEEVSSGGLVTSVMSFLVIGTVWYVIFQNVLSAINTNITNTNSAFSALTPFTTETMLPLFILVAIGGIVIAIVTGFGNFSRSFT